MVGELILDRFRIDSRIGSGGFGTVYRAWDERLQRAVAVKVIESPDGSPRVTREAQAVARLSHRNIAALYELASDGRTAFLVSELIEGETLRALGRRGELSDRLVAEIGADAAAALAHAHRNGVVHRDVKPENILVSTDGQAKLVDFGIARISGERSLTATGAVLGTLAYMAPEQADGLRPGPTADVYSLAITLYECLCGEHPLLREGPAATARAIGEAVPALGAVRPDLPSQLTEILDACLDPDPEIRPLASELEAALAAHAGDLEGAPLPAVAGPAAVTPAGRGRRIPWPRLVPAASIAALTLAPLIVAGPAPPAVLLAAPLAGILAIGRPRPALALGVLASIVWLGLGAGEPGAALVIGLLTAPLVLVPAGTGRAVALPALGPLFGMAGIAAAFPAIAGLTRHGGERVLLGAAGYLWLAAWELVSGRTLLLGGEAPAPRGWNESAGTAAGEVILPLLAPTVLIVAVLWGTAAFTLPLLVRGRVPVLDLIGALIWAAGLTTLHRLLAGPGGEPPGLLVAAIAAALIAAFAARRLRGGRDGTAASLAAPSTGGTL